MKTVFSGVWQSKNTSLITKLNQLSQLAKSEFDIEISIEKMLVEEHYRQLVLSELFQLGHKKINHIIGWLNSVDKPKQSSHKKPSKNTMRLLAAPAVIISLGVLILLGIFSFYQPSILPVLTSKNATQQIRTALPVNSAKAITALTDNLLQVPAQIKPQEKTQVVFRLHGSNTIGEKLAPKLLEGFLQQQHINNFTWQTTNKPLERTLTYQQDGQNYAIELHAHGSSTAFTDLKSSKADIGMASRRIKTSEIKQLQQNLGDLNKVGNEHIIGLDGLAVIVNQNNAIKQLSSETLAKIFSGTISNWSQLGGPPLPIQLYARDQHSGTWDTFKNLVLKKYRKKLAKQAIRLESSSELSNLVSQNEGAIGFIGLNYVLHNKALAISATKDTTAIFPTRFTIGTEDYALSRRLYFYTPTSASDIVKNFAQFTISRQGQEIVAATGLISQNIKLEQAYPLKDAPVQYNQYTKNAKRLSLNFRFDYATKDLDNKGKRDLQRLVSFMEEHNGRRLVLMGFSDSIGAKLKNKDLSFKRAKSVEQALTSRGIPVLAVEAMGEALPIANNNTEAGRKRNRRVEVWLL